MSEIGVASHAAKNDGCRVQSVLNLTTNHAMYAAVTPGRCTLLYVRTSFCGTACFDVVKRESPPHQ